MKTSLISLAITSALLAGTAHNTYASDQAVSYDKHKQYIGTGIGATAGAIVAGPVGFIVGGLIGNLAGKHDAMDDAVYEQSPAVNEQYSETAAQAGSSPTTESEMVETIVVAQAGEIESNNNDDSVDHSLALKEILVKDINLDVFFLSGSTAVEEFYKSRIQAVSRLMQQLPDIDIHLEGYSDRRGDMDTNLALSNERLNSVHNELVRSGIDTSRIHMNAYGEQQFVSSPGDLEAYTFDRRVVIRFEHSVTETENPLVSLNNNPLD